MKDIKGLYRKFSTYFKVDECLIKQYGAYDINLIFDTPLFVDPFLLFNSEKEEYQKLHDHIINYLIFLKEEAKNSLSGRELFNHLKSYYVFPEVKECWLGFSRTGNEGAGLNIDFAQTLYNGLSSIVNNFGDETITKASHLEKVCLIGKNVSVDKISDFTLNLIKEYLLEYTENFAKQYIDASLCKTFLVDKVIFNKRTKTFSAKQYYLPCYNHNGHEEFVLLVPKDILRQDYTWINKHDMYYGYENILLTIPDGALRYQLERYIRDTLLEDEKNKATRDEINNCIDNLIVKFPEFIDYYIKYKEDNKDMATDLAVKEVAKIETFLSHNLKLLIAGLKDCGFYKKHKLDSLEEAVDAIKDLRKCIEVNGLWKNFYDKQGLPIEEEEDLNRMFRLSFRKSQFLYNEHVDNGNGICDAQISYGSEDCTIVEFKLARSKSLKQNLLNQANAYAVANNTNKKAWVIMFFNQKQKDRCIKILKDIDMLKELDKTIFLIDADSSNKISASKL